MGTAEILLAYLISIVAGYFTMNPLMDLIKSKCKHLPGDFRTNPDPHLVVILGVLERILYTTMIIIKKPEGMFAWLAIKVLTRWQQGEKEEPKSMIVRMNIYLIGNLLSVLISIAAVYLAMLVVFVVKMVF